MLRDREACHSMHGSVLWEFLLELQSEFGCRALMKEMFAIQYLGAILEDSEGEVAHKEWTVAWRAMRVF